ncbi:molybdopterin-synthase adenylyltransferase MoeB [Alkalimonas collagenimarina]|uniref:Molybdopterin-synthase adenylyltransferase MoeB n=1 Tax=Alkalimonas collagenimarina TaxID=400390 RepID=A0ABT9GWB9_9GAMM|nr:molybdopterin-synthase adenylyltransferase MoeB [Alkalimonas collagenimarina]MDP4535318.1 molybdopterin-synthase adenylyltransferase MoeB [Alkalimonas collagenimarina]
MSKIPTELTRAQSLRYSRHLMLPAMDFHGQEALLAARVLQIGVGGLGCAAASYLVASGVGTLTLVDDDQIDHSNLQRQVLFREKDIGALKAVTAVQQLQGMNQDVQLNALTERLDSETLHTMLAEYDLVLDCTDNLATRNAINAACFNTSTPLVSGAAIRLEGQVACFPMDGKHACYQCLSQLFGEQQLSCMESGVLSPLVGVIGSMQALEAIKILARLGTPAFGRLQLFDGLQGQWQSFILSADPNCLVCGGKAD